MTYNALEDAALEYGAQGIAIIPCAERGKKPALSTTGKEHAAASHDADQIRQWWATYPNANIGIVCTPNRLAVIDIDGQDWHRLDPRPTSYPCLLRGL